MCCAEGLWSDARRAIICSSLALRPAADGYLVKIRGDQGGKEGKWPPYITVLTARDKCSL